VFGEKGHFLAMASQIRTVPFCIRYVMGICWNVDALVVYVIETSAAFFTHHMSFSTGPLVNDAAKEIATQLVIAVNNTFVVAGDLYTKIPGSTILYKYAKSSYQNDPFRLVLELLLVAFMIWYFVHRRYNPTNPEVVLTEKEIQELIDEWEPEDLVPELTEIQKQELDSVPVLTGQVGLKTKTVDGREKYNFSSLNFLGIMNAEPIKERAIQALRKYGVGTCGPRGFYGTLDVHLELEAKLASFLGTEGGIIYSQGFSCISSVIPAFAKRGDVIIVDEAVNFAVQKGVQISRSHVYYFKHNDMQDLVRVVEQVAKERRKKRLPLCRQFIVVEGLYANYGDICPLPDLLEIKKKYKYRLMVEESMSIGVLGSRGAGVTDHFEIPASEVDIIVGSMANALGSAGGFCCGSNLIVEHQRLSGQAYTYSASLPAMSTVAVIEAIKILEQRPNELIRLAQNSETMLTNLVRSFDNSAVKVDGVLGSPIFHIRLVKPLQDREDEERILQEVVDLVIVIHVGVS
jgi:serine palmitoyltransferase